MTQLSPTTSQRHSSILVVDADPMGRLSTEALLIRNGFDAHAAVDAAEGLRILDTEKIGVVVLSTGADVQDATDLRRLCERAKQCGGAVVALCNGGVLAVDADILLVAPFAEADVLGALGKLLPKSAESSPSANAASPDSGLDRNTLDALAFALGSGADGVGAVIEVFAETVVAEHTRLKACVAAGDSQAIANSAHRMAGASLQIGAGALGSCCRRIETTVRNGDSDSIRDDVAALDALIGQALLELRAYRAPEATVFI